MAERGGTTLAEWAVAALGGVILVGIIGFLIVYGWKHPEGPPEVTVEAAGIREGPGGHVVEFVARNSGNSGAEDLRIVGLLASDGDVLERREALITDLPAKGERRGGVVFKRDPAGLALELRVEGYALP